MKVCFAPRGCVGGFTLTELIVTIAIAVALVCLLSPATSKVREAANNSKCMSNIRTVGSGVISYLGEFGKYPSFGQDMDGPNNPPYWGEKIEPYVGRHSKAYICPSEKSRWATPDENEKQPSGFTYAGAWYAGISYGANPAVVSHTWSPKDYVNTTPGMINRPSRTVLLTDTWDGRGVGTGISISVGHLGEYSRENPGNWSSFVKYRHGGKASVCFADGHVEQLTEKQLMPDRDKSATDPERSLWDLN